MTSQRADVFFFQCLFMESCESLQLDVCDFLLVNCLVTSRLSADVLRTLTSDFKLLNRALASSLLAAAVAAASLSPGDRL